MRILFSALLIASAPLLAWAEDASTLPVANSGNATQPRFFPVENARMGLPTTPKTVKPLRSDSSAMSSGYFRIDRKQAMPLKPTGPLIIRPTDNASNANGVRIIRGPGPSTPPVSPTIATPNLASTLPASGPLTGSENDSVLSLFANSSAPIPKSFRSALTGTGGGANLMPHQWPIAPGSAQKLSSNYGIRNEPFNNSAEFHSGVDIAAPIGTPVLASADGQVKSAGEENGYGKSITLQHPDGSESKYSHLSREDVRPGDYVKAGQTIGAVGSSGHSTGPHLDYRLSQEGVTIDPTQPNDSTATATVPTTPIAPQAPATPTPRRLSVETAKSERVIVVR